MAVFSLFRRFSSLGDSAKPTISPGILGKRSWNPIPLPHKTIPDPKGQDLDFINVAHSHLVHSDWVKLATLSNGFTPFRVKHIFFKIQKDYVLSLEFFNWVQCPTPDFHTPETYSIILHILTKFRKFKSAESILKNLISRNSQDFPSKLFESILDSYRLCDSSPRVFDLLFKTYAHMKKFRNATDTFCGMKEYGFLPAVESCNAYMSSLISLNRLDVALTFYKEMRRLRISPNIYTMNMVMRVFCKLGKVDKAVEVFGEIQGMGMMSLNTTSYNTLISGYCCIKGGLSSAITLKETMVLRGTRPDVVTYNTLINGLCKEGKLQEATRLFNEMKTMDLAPDCVTYNTLINNNNGEMGNALFEEMRRNGVKANILTYNALISGLCKEGKTIKAAYLVKDAVEKNKLELNASTFAALIRGQCVRGNADGANELYKTMKSKRFHPNYDTLNVLMCTYTKNGDFDGAAQVLREMRDRCMV